MKQEKRTFKEYGVTGVSIFYRWYDLCNFDPIYDQAVHEVKRHDREWLMGFVAAKDLNAFLELSLVTIIRIC